MRNMKNYNNNNLVCNINDVLMIENYLVYACISKLIFLTIILDKDDEN